MNVVKNLRITANAGSGKTYRLTSRYIELLARGAAPETIIALTFTRKAAGEFLDAIFHRLLEASTSQQGAADLAAHTGVEDLNMERCRGFLRMLTDSLHRLSLGTLDGFFARVLAAFPFECGLAGGISILSTSGQTAARNQALSALFREMENDARGVGEFLELIRQQNRNNEDRRVTEMLDRHISALHEKFLQTPPGIQWGDRARIWGGQKCAIRAEGTLAVQSGEFEALVFSLYPDMDEKSLGIWTGWFERVAALRPGGDVTPELMDFALKLVNPTVNKGPGFIIRASRKAFVFSEEHRALVSRLGLAILAHDLAGRVQRTQALHEIVAKFELAYDRQTRSAGRFTFADITGLLAAANGAAWRGQAPQAIDREELNFRLDALCNHWLIDEFQDTSRLQWAALRDLVDEVIQDGEGERSFFYVGDAKQSIYSWRGGDPRLFEEIAAYYNQSGEQRIETGQSLATSRRSKPEILDFVNAIFDPAGLKKQAEQFQFPDEALTRWSAAWRTHVPHDAAVNEGYVEWRTVEKSEDEEVLDGRDLETVSLIEDIAPHRKGWTCAVLAKSNKRVTALAQALRDCDIPASAEGEFSPCSDNDLCTALLSLMRWVAHPSDSLSHSHVLMTPLAELALTDGFRDTALASLVRPGYARTLRGWTEPFLDGLPRFARDRLAFLLRLAGEFDQSESGGMDEFLRIAEESSARENAPASPVRVMTMHSAKGLDFDMVVLPDMEGSSLASNTRADMLHFSQDRSGAVMWALDMPKKEICKLDPVLERAAVEDIIESCYEKLCLYYVAMTRAKRALYVFTNRQKEDATAKDFKSLLYHIFPGQGGFTKGNALWHEGPRAHPQVARAAPLSPFPMVPELPEILRPITPSHHGAHRRSAASCLQIGTADTGSAVHEVLASIEWLDGDFNGLELIANEEARKLVEHFLSSACAHSLFSRPAGAHRLWREQAFDVVSHGEWISGIFDRVVLHAAKDGLLESADLYDFKTDRADPVDLLASYSGQLQTYRQALSALTGLPEVRIRTFIVGVRDCALIV